jgi:hypothetical protein
MHKPFNKINESDNAFSGQEAEKLAPFNCLLLRGDLGVFYVESWKFSCLSLPSKGFLEEARLVRKRM